MSKKTISTFPNDIDDRIFFQDINISQVPVMNDYYKYLNAENYTMASEILNNSEVFFYGAWLLNLLENRLYEIGNYVSGLEKEQLVTYIDTLLPNEICYSQMNWIGDNDIIEFREDYIDIYNNIYLGTDVPDDNLSLHDIWINTNNSPDIYINKNNLNYYDGLDEPDVSIEDENNIIWIGGE